MKERVHVEVHARPRSIAIRTAHHLWPHVTAHAAACGSIRHSDWFVDVGDAATLQQMGRQVGELALIGCKKVMKGKRNEKGEGTNVEGSRTEDAESWH